MPRGRDDDDVVVARGADGDLLGAPHRRAARDERPRSACAARGRGCCWCRSSAIWSRIVWPLAIETRNQSRLSPENVVRPPGAPEPGTFAWPPSVTGFAISCACAAESFVANGANGSFVSESIALPDAASIVPETLNGAPPSRTGSSPLPPPLRRRAERHRESECGDRAPPGSRSAGAALPCPNHVPALLRSSCDAMSRRRSGATKIGRTGRRLVSQITLGRPTPISRAQSWHENVRSSEPNRECECVQRIRAEQSSAARGLRERRHTAPFLPQRVDRRTHVVSGRDPDR